MQHPDREGRHMQQIDEIVKLLSKLDVYLRSGSISCMQVPIEDILIFISEEYNSVALDGSEALSLYHNIMSQCVEHNDIARMSHVIRLIQQESLLFNELYREKMRYIDQDHITAPYIVRLQYLENIERNRKVSNVADAPGSQNTSFKGKGAVFSAITGEYDQIRIPDYIDERLDYIMFTDNPELSSDIWKIRKIENTMSLDPTRLARKIKILGGQEYLSDYDFTIWTDGKVQIIGDLFDYISKYSLGAPLLCFNHYYNTDLYKEAETCIMLDRDDPETIRSQMARYRSEGYPEDNGLIDSCVLLRDNRDQKLKEAMLHWWREVENGSRRDQLSFNYVCWKDHIIYDTSPLISFMNPYTRIYRHDKPTQP